MSRVQYIEHMGTDLRVTNAARVSFNKWKDEFDDADAKLLRYLAEHRHDSPFFHPQVCMIVEAPIFVARQLFRHEVGKALNEVSRRYVDEAPEVELPVVWRGRPGRGQSKQGSSGPLPNQEEIQRVADAAIAAALKGYDDLLALGVAPEQARVVLPLATMTKWIWTASLAFYSRVCRDRLAPDAQAETRDVAAQIDAIMRDIYTTAWPLLLGETT